ncbi:hypothetical protein KC19_4G047700 [Ceratodon purpureus]|uniref:Uncharacterized protein n=1 Tax=Ceratodon purpureus TaxID=3225 RepID=A0A8T0I716_CERPU|nr:hypothetical protein KC19_4G047700 [Ceratodon purpureus]
MSFDISVSSIALRHHHSSHSCMYDLLQEIDTDYAYTLYVASVSWRIHSCVFKEEVLWNNVSTWGAEDMSW